MGSLTLAELLAGSDDDHVGKMKVLAVIEALPGVGKVKARRTMEEIGIADTRRVRGPRRAAAQGAARRLLVARRRGLLITISGLPGSGTTTVSRLVADALGLERLPGGEVFRQMAAEAGMTLAEFGAHAQGHPEIDRELDDRLEARAAAGGCVIESRLAGWLATRAGLAAVRVWVECADEVRAGRVADRDGTSLAQALARQRRAQRPRTGALPGRLRHRPRRPVHLRPGARLDQRAAGGPLGRHRRARPGRLPVAATAAPGTTRRRRARRHR